MDKPIDGYEDSYTINELGECYSLPRLIERPNNSNYITKRRKKAWCDNGKGYQTIHLTKDGKHKRIYVHILVARAFIPNPDNLPCVNHKDGNKRNNHVDNLEWISYQDNLIHYQKILQSKEFIGSSFNKASNSYNAQISINGIDINLGNFTNPEEAQMAYYDAYINAYGKEPFEMERIPYRRLSYGEAISIKPREALPYRSRIRNNRLCYSSRITIGSREYNLYEGNNKDKAIREYIKFHVYFFGCKPKFKTNEFDSYLNFEITNDML